MDLKTVQTRHVPVRYLEGGSGPDLVYLHGAGGITADDPFLAELGPQGLPWVEKFDVDLEV